MVINRKTYINDTLDINTYQNMSYILWLYSHLFHIDGIFSILMYIILIYLDISWYQVGRCKFDAFPHPLHQEGARKRSSSRDRRGAAKAASLSSARRKSAPAGESLNMLDYRKIAFF